ncbi:MAG TPA: phage tail protein [Pyrinomonadaceae bacterium]|nr:phage tail protein [Pyrinomonadaceae bacterium]
MPKTGDRQDPFLAFRFEVTLEAMPVAGFSDCTGLQLETEVQDYNEGGLNTHVLKFPTRTKQTNIVLKRGIVDRAMWDWYWLLTQGLTLLRSGSITVRDPSGGTAVMEWQFSDAFPCKWLGPDLNAMQNSVAVETVELCHRGLTRTK